MQYVRLGNTGLKVSRLCLGCMTYGSKSWRPWVLEEEESRPFFRAAIVVAALKRPYKPKPVLDHQ